MKISTKKSLQLYFSLAGFCLLLANPVAAQFFTPIYTFSATSDYINSDGASPFAGLLLVGDVLYGTTYNGGDYADGTVFSVKTDGTDFRTLHTFTGGSDGGKPFAGLVLSGTNLYGTASVAETDENGTGAIFSIDTNGVVFNTLHVFNIFTTGADGDDPVGGLVLSGNTLFGTTEFGGSTAGGDVGSVFKVNTDGSGYANLYYFTPGPYYGNYGLHTNAAGLFPCGNLILSGSTLYGTASGGGANGFGTIFSINTNGTDVTPLYSFTDESRNSDSVLTNLDGGLPQAGLVLSNGILYGTAYQGGSNGYGTVFSVKTDGTDFTTLYAFTGSDDVGYPSGGLVLSGKTFTERHLEAMSWIPLEDYHWRRVRYLPLTQTEQTTVLSMLLPETRMEPAHSTHRFYLALIFTGRRSRAALITPGWCSVSVQGEQLSWQLLPTEPM